MTKDEIEIKQNQEFLELLEKTRKIKNKWEVYNFGEFQKKSDKTIAEKIYEESFLMPSILDTFTFRESLNLKEILEIVLSEKVPRYFFDKVSIQKIYAVIIEMIKLGYIEPYRKEETVVPIFQLTKLGVKILQERTLQNLALTGFYNYQSYNLNKKAINLSLIALAVSIIAVIITIYFS